MTVDMFFTGFLSGGFIATIAIALGLHFYNRRQDVPQDWICTVKWVQATVSEGAWLWTLRLVDVVDGERIPKLHTLEEGVAMTKLGVYWNVWRACRKRRLKFQPWSKTWISGEMS